MKLITKSRLRIIALMLVLSLILCVKYLNSDPISTHDVSYHMNRILGLSYELNKGNIPVLIHHDLLRGLGYANSLFYPELFLYIPAILVILGVNLILSYKILMIICTFFTLVFSYRLGKKFFKNENASWLMALIYTTSYYRLTDIFVRGAIGEVLAITFFPVVIYGMYNLIFEDGKRWYYIPFAVFGIVNSHVLSFAMTVILIVFLIILNIDKIIKDKKKCFLIFLAGFISIILSVAFIFPYLEQEESNELVVDNHESSEEFMDMYGTSIWEIFAIYRTNGMDQGREHIKSIGFLLIIMSTLVLFTKKNELKRYMIELWIISLGLCVLSLGLLPWDKIVDKFSFISIIQFPYRFHILSSALLSVVSAYSVVELLKNDDKKILALDLIYLIISVLIVFTFNTNGMNYDFETILTLNPIGNGEYLPIELDELDLEVYNVNEMEKEIEYETTSRGIRFNYINDKYPLEISVPLTYYKGYNAYIRLENGNTEKLMVEKNEVNKHVLLKSDKNYSGTIEVKYEMTNIQKISYFVTWISFIGLSGYVIYSKRKLSA